MPQEMEKMTTGSSDSAESLFSTCPAGESFPLPQPKDYQPEFMRLQRLVNEQRLLGRQIVVVMGVGFVGAVVDCFGMLDDLQIRRYFELDCEVKALGRGHIKRIKDQVRDGRK